jgi:3-hydroxy-5-methyl-1-naphthoate 3-O-methyltransferase
MPCASAGIRCGAFLSLFFAPRTVLPSMARPGPAHELDLFSRLSGTTGTTAGGLAEALAIEERPAEMLLTGCAALGLLVKNDGRYVNSPLAEEFLVRGKPCYFGGWVQMLDQRLYPGGGG